MYVDFIYNILICGRDLHILKLYYFSLELIDENSRPIGMFRTNSQHVDVFSSAFSTWIDKISDPQYIWLC